jgi:hypothetical protein
MIMRVFICSQYGNLESNLVKARAYCKYSLHKGYATFAPHIEYSSILSDADDEERELGISAGLSFLLVCGEMWVFVVDGVLSSGMKREIKEAIKNNVMIRWFDATDINDISELLHLPPDQMPIKRDFIPNPGKVTAKKFSEVEALLKQGVKYEDMVESIDDLLGTTLPERDRDAEETYETYRDIDRRQENG